MDIAMIGLGRMGANMTQRLLQGGHRVVVYDRSPDAVKKVAELGAEGAASLQEVAEKLKPPRAMWIMIPPGKPVEDTIAGLQPHLEKGDVLIDGGNTYYKDDIRRGEALAAQGLHYVDAGTSGGIWGLKEGYALMIGGDKAVVDRLNPIWETLAPAPDKGWGHVGPIGSGHFVKMVHNGIEYGLMQAYAEGFALMQHKDEFGLDLAKIAELWRTGSVIRSWLLDLTADALKANPTLEGIAPYVEDTGEGRWTVMEAIDKAVPLPVITLSLQARFRSRDSDSIADKILAVMRNQFGGHAIHKESVKA